MTLSIAWIRKIKGVEELVIASDSRLVGGMRWDQCPKMMTLPRSDSVISFAGNTIYTYPLMLQLFNAIQAHSRAFQRAMDLHDLKGHVLHVFNELQQSVYDVIDKEGIYDAQFILGGYSWIRKAFAIWLVHYEKSEKMFRCRPAGRLIGKFDNIVFAGDWAKTAKIELKKLLQSRYGLGTERFEGTGFNMEPFEVLRELLRKSGKNETIGGAPQVIKVYQHMNCRPFGVYWTDQNGQTQVTLFGRPLMGYENMDYWVLDPDTLKTTRYCKFVEEES